METTDRPYRSVVKSLYIEQSKLTIMGFVMDETSSQAASAALTNIGNYVAAGNFGRKSLKNNKKLFDYQHAQTIADWNMMNDYNSPQAQMARFKKAGLNPNLIYGDMSNAPAVNTGSIASPQMQSYQADAQPPATMLLGYDARIREAQYDNLKTQNNVLTADAMLKAANTLKSLTDTEGGKLSNKLNNATLDYQIDAKKLAVQAAIAQIKSLQASTQSTTDSNTRANQLQPGSLAQQSASIGLTLLQQAKTASERRQIEHNIQLLKDSHVMNEFEIDLNKRGFTKSDDVKYRIANKVWDAIMDGKSVREAANAAADELKKSTGVNILPRWFQKNR